MGWDPEVWEEPMEFKPERFLVNDGVVTTKKLSFSDTQKVPQKSIKVPPKTP
ncbi:putative unspecific monooxygenase [Helianthus debilis subsp. tardiflorus]